jgi:dihydroorotase
VKVTPKPKLLLRNARVLNPEKGSDVVADVYLEDGIIRRITPARPAGPHVRHSPLAPRLSADDVEVWELKGKCVAPGFIDLHCHLREPGREDEETIRSGTRAALAGGFTTVCCMPNTNPPIDNENIVRAITLESERVGQARVLPIAAATKGRAGAEMTEIGALVNAGAVAVSDDGDPIANPEVMRRVLEYAKIFDIPVISHCEERTLTSGGAMNEGSVSTRLGLPGIPACAEEIMVMRDILLADYAASRLHVAHVSTKGSVALIRWAKSRGIPVTGETCPHYFTLTDALVENFDTNYKVNPPLRTEADIVAIKEGLSDGTIDAIATDHAPHLTSEKEVEFEQAPFGMIGFETAFALGISELVNQRVLSLADYLARLTIAPGQIIRRPYKLAPGSEVNLVVFDPKLKWIYQAEGVRSQSRNSPFIGRELTGKVLATIIGAMVAQF